MDHSSLIILGFGSALAVQIAFPVWLGALRQDVSKWTAVFLSTIVSPFLILAAFKVSALVYWAIFRSSSTGGGCSGGECGGAAVAAGYWPLLLLFFLPISFVFSVAIILVMRRRSTK
jgi:hypothetical protein